MRVFEYIIPEEFNKCKISAYLKTRDYSEKVLKTLRNNPHSIVLNGQEVYMNSLINSGDVLHVNLYEDAASENVLPVNIPIDILYEDQDILVINKPAGMPIHPSLNNYDNTLGNAVAYYMQTKEEDFVYRCINRLDRDTSGVTIIAKNMLAASILQTDMKNRLISRTYLALVEGRFDENQGTIDAPIAREGDSIITRCVDFNKGKTAITHFQVLGDSCISGNNVSLVRCNLDTGRTHQIRVHMKYIGHPLLGDTLYNPSNTMLSRQGLHGGEISFVHPISKMPMLIEAPLPEDMSNLVRNICRGF